MASAEPAPITTAAAGLAQNILTAAFRPGAASALAENLI